MTEQTTATWKYPLYILHHQSGYVSIVSEDSESGAEDQNTAPQDLALFSSEQKAADFLAHVGIMAGMKKISGDRELKWLLKSLKSPVTGTVMDPLAQKPEDGSPANQWRMPVQDLSACLRVDFSPWSYPVFAIKEAEGWSSISALDSVGDPMFVVMIFTSVEKAESFAKEAGINGEVKKMNSVGTTRSWLESMPAEVKAVAMDPVIEDGVQKAKHGFAIERLLADYLVYEKEAGS